MIKLSKRSILTFLIVLLVCAVFETLQQNFYIHRYQLYKDVYFSDLFIRQLYRWLIWGLLAYVLYIYVLAIPHGEGEGLNERFLLRTLALNIGLVALDILLISILSWLINGDTGSFGLLFSEHIPFFIFQKAPIFTLGYLAIAIIFYLDRENTRLQFEIQSLNDLQQQERQKFEQLQNRQQDNPLLLNIKVGNKHKIIAVEDIYYLEADDYCVKVFSTNERAYTMRASLKAMEQKLPPHFFRAHRKYLVNTKFVKELVQQQGHQLVLENEVALPVAKNRVGAFKRTFSFSD
ncbi:MAG: LytTR family DNA-binding domain-containing protein [Bacteroidota bacterium]